MIETERRRLRPLTLEDASTVQQLAGRREFAAMTLSIPHPYSLEQAKKWMDQRIQSPARTRLPRPRATTASCPSIR